MNVLVTGGAGYVGSVVVEELVARAVGEVIVLDDLSAGHAAAVSEPARLIVGDIADDRLVTEICRVHRIDAAIHMAASGDVRESVEYPDRYYQNNVVKSLALLDALLAAGVRRLVFSSTAAVYRGGADRPLTEDDAADPASPYGETKFAFERALRWYTNRELRFVALRYFNAAGATEAHGECHRPETHLIPLILDVARGRREHISVHGADYATSDGTCVRDYVHVADLARAHALALERIDGLDHSVYNLGTSRGFTVAEVVAAARRLTGHAVPTQLGARRAGDPAVLVAASDRARRELGWTPERSTLDQILGDAWAWIERYPSGYPPRST